jgi:hypothetical protein
MIFFTYKSLLYSLKYKEVSRTPHLFDDELFQNRFKSKIYKFSSGSNLQDLARRLF